MNNNSKPKMDYFHLLLQVYYPLHFFALFRAHELYNVEPYIELLKRPILDLGCGDGTISELLFGYTLDYGIDISIPEVKRSKENRAYNQVLQSDAHHIPLKDNYLGGVFSNCVLEHIPAMPALIREISRVLKTGAYFVATCLTPLYYTMNPIFKTFDRPGLRWLRHKMIIAENKLHNHVSVFDAETYRHMFEDNDMVLETCKYYSPEPVSNFCYKWDTASKYQLPFPVKLKHSGFLVKYLKLRYRVLADKEVVIKNWYTDFKDLCYDRNEANQGGIGQILVARKL